MRLCVTRKVGRFGCSCLCVPSSGYKTVVNNAPLHVEETLGTNKLPESPISSCTYVCH